MKLNLEEQEETIEPVEKTDLIYGIDDRPPFKEALFAALQHLLAIFVAIITPPLIIAGALKLDLETTGFLVSMALFASGVSTFIQCRRIGPVGAKLLCIQGTSFSFIGPISSTTMPDTSGVMIERIYLNVRLITISIGAAAIHAPNIRGNPPASPAVMIGPMKEKLVPWKSRKKRLNRSKRPI